MNLPKLALRLAAACSFAVIPALPAHRACAQNALLAPAAESTSVAASPASTPQAAKNPVETTISLGSAAQLTATRTNESKTSFQTQSLYPSASVFATFRQTFKPWLGYSVNFGYTRAPYHFVSAAPAPLAGPTAEGFIPNNVYETSISYIAQKRLTDRWTVVGEAGVGALTFASINRAFRFTPATAFEIYKSDSYRPEGIAGFGIDYRMAHGLALRAQYRSLFFKYPDYGAGGLRLSTVSSQPTLSLTYSLGRHSRR